MALLAIKPSRGTIGFFVLLIGGLLVRSGWRSHETQLVVRDLPHSHATRRLLRCVLGRDATRLLGPRPADGSPSPSPWETAITDRMRLTVRANWSPAWPARCVPIAERLANRLEGASDARRAWYPAREVARLLAEASSNPTLAVQHVEDGSLPQALAQLATAVSAISDGAQEGWSSPLAPAATDLYPVRGDELPTPTPLPLGADDVTLAMPDLVLARDVSDGRLHAITFTSDSPVGVDHAPGLGAPVAGSMRDGATRVVDDRGESVFLPGGEPAQLVRLPDAISTGREALGDEWQVVLAGESLWVMDEDLGALRLRATPRQGEVRWSDAPLASLGPPETFAGGLVLPGATPDAVRVGAFRRGATGLSVEGYTVTQPAAADAATAAEPVGPAQTLVPEWTAFAPHFATCVAGPSLRYALVRADDGLSVVWFDGTRAERSFVAYGDAGVPVEGGRIEFTCGESGALVYGDFVGRSGTLVYFDRATGLARVVEPPRYGRSPSLVGGALLGGGGLVALVDNGATLRVWRNDVPAETGTGWTGGTVVAMQHAVTPEARAANPAAVDDVRLVEVTTVSSHANQVALLVRVTVGAHEYTGRVASYDRGATWR